MRLNTWAFLALFSLAAACGEVTEDEADSSVQPTFDAPPGSPDAEVEETLDAMPIPDGASCGAGNACMPAAPANWNGPVLVYEGSATDPAPTCPGHWPVENQTVKSGLTPQGSCGCECAAATGLSCGSANVFTHSTSTCNNFNPTFQSISPGQCKSMSVSASSYYAVNNPNTSGGSCAPSVVDTLATPTWDQTIRSCGNDTLTGAGCEADQVCAPGGDALFDRVCIWSSGDNACPVNSPYSERSVVYDDFTDNRACAQSCTCGTPTGKCNPRIAFIDSCSAPLPTLYFLLQPGSCTKGSPGPITTYGRYTANPEATCQPSAGTVNGAAAPTGPSTYCCLP